MCCQKCQSSFTLLFKFKTFVNSLFVAVVHSFKASFVSYFDPDELKRSILVIVSIKVYSHEQKRQIQMGTLWCSCSSKKKIAMFRRGSHKRMWSMGSCLVPGTCGLTWTCYFPLVLQLLQRVLRTFLSPPNWWWILLVWEWLVLPHGRWII